MRRLGLLGRRGGRSLKGGSGPWCGRGYVYHVERISQCRAAFEMDATTIYNIASTAGLYTHPKLTLEKSSFNSLLSYNVQLMLPVSSCHTTHTYIHIFPLASAAAPFALPVISDDLPFATPDSSDAFPCAAPAISDALPLASPVDMPVVSLTFWVADSVDVMLN